VPSVSEVEDVAAAAELLRRLSAAGRTVSIDREGGDVVLSTARLDRVLEHETGDLTCTVEAGVRLADLASRLAPYGQMLALDPPGDPTIGACIAADLSGPRRHRYGSVRDLVLGVTVVLGDGTVASSGGKVVKNVAGYDLGKLYCGSVGTLGLIVRASLRLHPRPEVSRTLVVPVSSADDAWSNVRSLLRSQLVLSALDVHWPGRIAVLVEGSERAVARQLEEARALVPGEEGGEDVWAEAAAAQARAGGRLSFPPGELAGILTEHGEAIVRAAAGVAYVPEPVPDSRDPGEVALVERIRAQLDPHGTLAQ
jgi:glycolate oxidase FAD binding subunit